MSTISPSVRGKSWVFPVTALSVILGMLLALSLRTYREAEKAGVYTRSAAVENRAGIYLEQNVKLRQQIDDYRLRIEKMSREQVRGAYGSNASDFQRVLDDTKMIAGTEAVHGPGVVVVLHDSTKNSTGMNEELRSQYIVHDRDIREIANELFAAGAEVVCVNGQRLVANSSIRCVGPVVRVNSFPIAPPFIIKAIGDSKTLEGALSLPGGPAEGLFLLNMIEVTRQPDVSVPAYSGATAFKFARRARQEAN